MAESATSVGWRKRALLPIRCILKRALDEIEAAAHRFNSEELPTWKESRDSVLQWIESTKESNTQSSLSTCSRHDPQSSEGARLVNTHVFDTNHRENTFAEPEVETAIRSPCPVDTIYRVHTSLITSSEKVHSYSLRLSAAEMGNPADLPSSLTALDVRAPPLLCSPSETLAVNPPSSTDNIEKSADQGGHDAAIMSGIEMNPLADRPPPETEHKI
ncbi:hypothetical protein R1flu_007062 [Riccia fluitans]|uniref:Uncharacterized protein n=1 Tax=Riccia fluitans TaxID=41844 RepID=A0ABD1YXS3_9MARC